jgi:hypothetical protein
VVCDVLYYYYGKLLLKNFVFWVRAYEIQNAKILCVVVI